MDRWYTCQLASTITNPPDRLGNSTHGRNSPSFASAEIRILVPEVVTLTLCKRHKFQKAQVFATQLAIFEELLGSQLHDPYKITHPSPDQGGPSNRVIKRFVLIRIQMKFYK